MKPDNEKFFVEIVAGCLWLTQTGMTTGIWDERGLWETEEDAASALRASFASEA